MDGVFCATHGAESSTIAHIGDEMAASLRVVEILPEQHRIPVREGETAQQINAATEGQILQAVAIAPRETSNRSGNARREVSDDVAHNLYVVMRLNRWGYTERWLTRVGVRNPKPQEPRSWWGSCVLDGNVEQIGIESMRDICPWNLDEARETGLCVNALPGHLSAAVIEEYVKVGERAHKAWRLGIEPGSMRRRLNIAHVLLLELFNLAGAGLPLECSYQGPGRPKDDDGVA